MELLKKQDICDPGRTVREFLEATPHASNEEPPDTKSLTARLCVESLELFRAIIKRLQKRDDYPRSKSKAHYISIERSYGRLKLWSDSYDISQEELDELLAKSRKLRRATLKLLTSISTTLMDRLGVLCDDDGLPESSPGSLGGLVIGLRTLVEDTGDDYSETSSSGTSSNFEHDNLEEIAEDLMTDTTCLMELDPLIKSPVLDTRMGKAAAYVNIGTWEPHSVYCDRVENRFPQAEISLILRLGKANYQRYIRCQEERDRQEDAQEPDAGLILSVEGSKFHDSAIGSSRQNTSSYAETIMSYGGGADRSVRVPPLPTEARTGNPFTCVACGKSVIITNNSAWKRHLYLDLCPWLCLDASCSFGDKVFQSKSDWISHLGLNHGLAPYWFSFECPLCYEDTGNGKTAITRHIGGHLEEISLGALPSGVNFDSESDHESQESPEDEPEDKTEGFQSPQAHISSRNISPVQGNADIEGSTFATSSVRSLSSWPEIDWQSIEEVDEFARKLQEEAEAEIGNHVRQLQEANEKNYNHVRQLEEAEEKRDNHVRQLQEAKAKKDNHVRQLQKKAEYIGKRIRLLRETNAEMDNHTRQLQETKAEMDNHTRQLQEAKAEQDNHIRQLQEAEAEQDNHIRQLQEAEAEKIDNHTCQLQEEGSTDSCILRHGSDITYEVPSADLDGKGYVLFDAPPPTFSQRNPWDLSSGSAALAVTGSASATSRTYRPTRFLPTVPDPLPPPYYLPGTPGWERGEAPFHTDLVPPPLPPPNQLNGVGAPYLHPLSEGRDPEPDHSTPLSPPLRGISGANRSRRSPLLPLPAKPRYDKIDEGYLARLPTTVQRPRSPPAVSIENKSERETRMVVEECERHDRAAIADGATQPEAREKGLPIPEVDDKWNTGLKYTAHTPSPNRPSGSLKPQYTVPPPPLGDKVDAPDQSQTMTESEKMSASTKARWASGSIANDIEERRVTRAIEKRSAKSPTTADSVAVDPAQTPASAFEPTENSGASAAVQSPRDGRRSPSGDSAAPDAVDRLDKW